MLSSLFGMVRTVRWGTSHQWSRPSGELMALDGLNPQVHHGSGQCCKLVRDRPRPVPWNAGLAIAMILFGGGKDVPYVGGLWMMF